jgi:hypothetical protein
MRIWGGHIGIDYFFLMVRFGYPCHPDRYRESVFYVLQ